MMEGGEGMRTMTYVAVFLMGAFYGVAVGVVIGDAYGVTHMIIGP